MPAYVWPSEDGWPYPDSELDVADPALEDDDDLFALRGGAALHGLDPIERDVIMARFGLNGDPPQTMQEVMAATGLDRSVLRQAMGTGLAKLRTQLR
ncbi:MAG TPA: sigma factor-like helix-turn-helix DNA-binding protein [Acidimicrobiales bacterium]|nr:sigma factor-like helix-turn-helix DNA-binding protein [Acidimicrobiales bacterium]